MTRARTVFILGIWVAILPYLGFPSLLKNLLFAVTGFIFMYFGYKLYRELNTNTSRQIFDNFSESNYEIENEIGN